MTYRSPQSTALSRAIQSTFWQWRDPRSRGFYDHRTITKELEFEKWLEIRKVKETSAKIRNAYRNNLDKTSTLILLDIDVETFLVNVKNAAKNKQL